MAEGAPGRRSGVDGVGEAPQLDALLVQLADQIDRMLDRPAQSVKHPDDPGIALTQHFECLDQAWPVCPRAALFLRKVFKILTVSPT